MMNFTVRSLCSSIGAVVDSIPDAVLDRMVGGVTTDSRQVKSGDVFFAIRGERFDGAEYIESALKAGAILAVADAGSMRPSFADLPVAAVPGAIHALGDAARAYRRLFAGSVVAVTGSSGKTTAKEMMLAVLKTGFAVHGTSGNYNNLIGVPLTVFGLDTAHECAVFELGMSAAGEIARLAEIVGPHIGVVLNVGPAHMEFFPSVEAIADAKMELLGALGKDGTAVVNGDDPLLRGARSRCRCGLVTFAVESDADYRAENVQVGDNGCAVFEAEGNAISLAVPGVHNVYNALAAYTVGCLLGIDGVMAAKALGKVSAPAMRMEIAEKRGITFINDAYNANPLSMKSAADVLRRMRPANGGRRVAVLGSMLELGGISAEAHHAIGAEYGRIGLAWLCLVGDGAEDYRRGALESGMEDGRIRCFGDSAAAASFIGENTHAGDVVLVKGSRGIRMERVLAD